MKVKWKNLCSYTLTAMMCMGIIGSQNMQTVNAEPVITQIPNTDRVESKLDGSFFSINGFAKGKVNERSEFSEGDAEYAVITNEYEFLQAIEDAKSGSIKVMEIRNDLYLGWNELSEEAKEDFSGGIIEQYSGSNILSATPVANPSLIESGISTVTINDIEGLTIFSQSGNTIKHAEIKLNTEVNDVAIRNLKFDDVWEWDDWRQSGFGSTGGTGTHKRSGWTFLKINGANNIWLDHCTFGISFDGNVDLENGASGITFSWCEFGDVNHEVGSMIYKTAMYMEQLYQESKVPESTSTSFVMYGIMRDNGMTMDQIMDYMSVHSKTHLVGSGDKDTWLQPIKDDSGNLQYEDETFTIGDNIVRKLLTAADTTKINANERLRLTLAYNHYTNMGQRVPMVRSGVGHMYNVYIDDMSFKDALTPITAYNSVTGSSISSLISKAGGSVLSLTRCINARNEASIAADTCVFYGAEDPIIGAENQLQDLTNMNGEYLDYWTWNHPLIVNSSSTKHSDKNNTYVGSSWDNDGENMFTRNFKWYDKSTINNWSWGQEGEQLSYSYQTFPLEDVVENTTKYSGAGKIEMTAKDWLSVIYDKSFEIKEVDRTTPVPLETIGIDKQNATIFLDEHLQLDVKLMPLNTTFQEKDLLWTSSNEAVAIVNDCGLVSPVSNGKTTIQVATTDGKTASCEVSVSNLPEELSIINLPETIYVGDIRQLNAEVSPAGLIDNSVEWASQSSRFDFIDSDNGIMEAYSAGSGRVSITANLTGNRVGSKPVSKTFTLKIVEPEVYVTDVNLDLGNVSVATGDSIVLKANVLPENADNQEVNWTSSNKEIATVDSNGVVTGVSEGTSTITVTSINKGISKTCEVTVTPTVDLKKGDVDNSGLVDANDSLLVLKYIVYKESFSSSQIQAADVNGDSKVDANDMLTILKYSVGKITDENWNK